MEDKELNNWYCSLTIVQKEHIARKIAESKSLPLEQSFYPNSVKLWLPLSLSKKQAIHDHCTDDHGMWIQKSGDGHIYSF